MPDFDRHFYNWYYYSNNLAVFQFSNDEYRAKHFIKETIVILSTDDLTPGGILQKVLLGLVID